MTDIERRRSIRVPVLQEEAAVILAGGREQPVKIVELSKCGALVNVLDMPALGTRDFDTDQRLELSIQHKNSVFHITARVSRCGPLFVALEFIDDKEDVRLKLEAKLFGLSTGTVGSA